MRLTNVATPSPSNRYRNAAYLAALLGSLAAAACTNLGDPSPGSRAAAVSWAPSSADKVTVDGGQGDAGTPVAVFASSPIDFGLTNCGSSAPVSLTVSNAGTGTLTVAASTSGSWFSVTPASASIPPGGSSAFSVAVTVPASVAAATARTGKLIITTNQSSNARTVIPLSATSQGATLAYPSGSPKQVAFGATVPGTTVKSALVLQNVGNAAATFAFGAPSNAVFTQNSVDPANAFTAAPGGEVTVSLEFLPTGTGADSGTMSVSATSGALCGSSVAVVKMSGAGENDALTGWPTSFGLPGLGIDFGPTACGSAGPTQSFTLSNGGTKSVTVTQVSLSGDPGYSVNLASGTVVPAGGSVAVNVTAPAVPFPGDPTTTYPGTLTIDTNVTSDKPHALSLSEAAYGAVVTLQAASGFGTFGATPVGTVASQPFEIVTTQTPDVTDYLSVSVTGDTTFGLSSNELYCCGGSATVPDAVTFSPTEAGSWNGTLTVTADVLCQPAPAPVALSGSAAGTGLALSTSSLSFNESCASGPSQSFSISNFSGAPVTWSVASAGDSSDAGNSSDSSDSSDAGDAGDASEDLFTFSPSGSTLQPNTAVTVTVTPSGAFPPNGTSSVNVAIESDLQGYSSVPLVLTVNEQGLPATCPNSGSTLMVSSASLSLYGTCNGAQGTTPSAPRSVTLSNTSASPVTFTATLPSTYLTVSPNGGTLSPGGSTTLTVSGVALTGYPPGENVSSTLTIEGAGETVPVSVVENFDGVFLPTTNVNFGDVPAGGFASQSLVIQDTQASLYEFGASYATPPFTLVSPGSIPAPTQTWTLDFRAPTAPGTVTGTANFYGYDVQFCTPNVIALSGTSD